MLKVWWGIVWRYLLMWVVFAIPAMLLYSLIEPTEISIKVKPTVGYGLLAVLMLILRKFEVLNIFIWKRIVAEELALIVPMYLAILSFCSSALNLLLVFNVTTEEWVLAKMLIGFFMFFICPLVVAFIVKFKESELINID